MKSPFEVNGPKLICNYYKYIPNACHDSKTFVVNSDLLVFDGYGTNYEYKSCVRKFCNKTKTWSNKTNHI